LTGCCPKEILSSATDRIKQKEFRQQKHYLFFNILINAQIVID